MKVKVKLNNRGIKQVTKQQQVALINTAEAIKKDLIKSQTMPFDIGTMQNDSTFVDEKKVIKGYAKIVTDTPYAREVYFDPEINIHTDKNPNARQYWFEPYISGEKNKLPIKYFKEFMKGK